ncbi:MAG: Hsp70 family protein [Ardenticatenales bacterium]|nr:Hsp70 family protein [Ardenticatenales bacterium]
MGTFVGIDLGTTFSAVAFINREGNPEIIPTDYGRTVTPSVVYLGKGGPIVGEEAKERQALGEVEIASFFKRSMGDSQFELFFQGKSYTPVDLSALVLQHLKQVAENHLGENVTHAVITVPAYFNNMQREATIEAAGRAGLEVLSIINEPTAAAFAYGMRPTQGAQTVLVYDLGGGTFDVSVVRITESEQQVLGTGGDHNLGGKDWDDRVFGYLVQQFEETFGTDPVGDDFNQLLVKTEEAKKSLSVRESVEIRVQHEGHKGLFTLTRSQFEDLTSDLMERTQRLTEQVLGEINLSWSDLTNVLLVGGSTRMPMVRTYVERMSGRPPLTAVNPDEAVALGAAIQAAMDMEEGSALQTPLYGLAGRKKSVDVISHSLGMIAVNEAQTRYIISIIIQKNQPIPSRQARPFTLRISQRGENKLEVYMTQGESDDPMTCAYLGRYVFSDIPALAARQAILDITYAYDKNGVVNVSAVERSTGKPLSLSIEPLPSDVPDRFALPPAQNVAREHLTVYLSFDLSGSMSGAPLTEAKKAAHAFISQCDLSSTSVGLISFSDNVLVDIKACQDAKKLSKAIDGLTIGRTGGGNEAHPFDEIHKLLTGVTGVRYALVLADGVWSNQSRAIQQAKRCHEAGIEIVGVGFGGADRKFLQAISSSDEHSFFTNMNALTETFSTIAQELTEEGSISKRGGLRF